MTGGRRGGSRFLCRAGRISALVAVLVAGLLICGVALAYSPVGPDFRISTTGNDGDPSRFPTNPDVAYNPTANEYLVVWEGDGVGLDGEGEIFGQRLSATGVELGGDFQISHVPPVDDADRDAAFPAVAYNPAANEFLVVWHADGLPLADQAFEVFGQRLSATGVEQGGDFQISNVTPLHTGGDAFDPAVAYNATADEYLVAWSGSGLATAGEFEIFGQRLSGPTGLEHGTDFRISTTGNDTEAGRSATAPGVAWGSGPNEYLVTWVGDHLADEDFEVSGQRVSAVGGEFGGDFQISNGGAPGDTTLTAQVPAVAYGSGPNEYVVVWQGELSNALAETFGQRVSVAGSQQGSDFRISHATDVAATRDALTPAIAYNGTANEYLVSWRADQLATDEEYEVFGDRLDAAATPGNDFRISTIGADMQTSPLPLEAPKSAFGSGPNEYLVTWTANGLAGSPNEYEIFGHRLAFPAPPQTQPTTQPDPTGQRAAALKKCKKKKKKKARKRCRKRAKRLPV